MENQMWEVWTLWLYEVSLEHELVEMTSQRFGVSLIRVERAIILILDVIQLHVAMGLTIWWLIVSLCKFNQVLAGWNSKYLTAHSRLTICDPLISIGRVYRSRLEYSVCLNVWSSPVVHAKAIQDHIVQSIYIQILSIFCFELVIKLFAVF